MVKHEPKKEEMMKPIMDDDDQDKKIALVIDTNVLLK